MDEKKEVHEIIVECAKRRFITTTAAKLAVAHERRTGALVGKTTADVFINTATHIWESVYGD